MAAQKRGLGRGLDALFEDNATDVGGASADVELRLTEIEPDREQPRCNFDENALDELATSIEQHGVLQPIVVRPNRDGSGYKIVAGERRWRAARLAGLSTIPAIVRELSDSEAAEIALVENLQRENLNPVEEAEGYRNLMERCGYTQEQAAGRIGKSRPTVANALRILSLPQEVLDMLRQNKLTAGHAKAILAIPDDRQRIEAATTIADQNLSVREAEKLCTKSPRQQKISLPREKSVIAQEVEISLMQSLGVEVKVDYKDGRGKMTVAYYSKEQLIDFANRLGGEK